jgi:hypothetical protein
MTATGRPMTSRCRLIGAFSDQRSAVAALARGALQKAVMGDPQEPSGVATSDFEKQDRLEFEAWKGSAPRVRPPERHQGAVGTECNCATRGDTSKTTGTCGVSLES